MFIKLTAFKIANAWINTEKIEIIFTENNVTKIVLGGGETISVSESPKEIVRMIPDAMRFS